MCEECQAIVGEKIACLWRDVERNASSLTNCLSINLMIYIAIREMPIVVIYMSIMRLSMKGCQQFLFHNDVFTAD